MTKNKLTNTNVIVVWTEAQIHIYKDKQWGLF